MKTIFRSLGMGGLLAVSIGLAAVSGHAQDACSDTAGQDTLQNKIRETYAKDKKTAIDAGKQLLEKFGTCEYSKDFVAWLNPQLPKWEKFLDDQAQGQVLKGILDRYDAGIKSKNYDDSYVALGELLAKFPDRKGNLNQILPLGLVGLYQSYPPTKNYKYNDQTLKYAALAASRLKANEEATKKNPAGVPVYGVFEFEMSKEDALSELAYAQAYITYWAKGDKKSALPLYFASIQMAGRHKDDPYSYATIAGFYADEAGRLGKEYAAKVATRSTTDTPEVAAQKEADIKTTEGLLKGYLDRAIDAYSRAYNYTKNDAASKATRDGIYKTIQDLYKLRYQKDTGINEFITATVAKPMPNPTNEVAPVIEADTTTTTGGDAAASVAANTTAAKPAATTTAKPATTTAKPVKPRK
jgi:hypothetical protein